jgi:hypothetical protein
MPADLLLLGRATAAASDAVRHHFARVKVSFLLFSFYRSGHMEHSFVPAAQAFKPIKKMLLGNGGSAFVRVGDTSRLLIHSGLNRPLTAFPWPFNLLQAHSVDYVARKGDVKVEEIEFPRRQINGAISKFLDGVPPDKDIQIETE